MTPSMIVHLVFLLFLFSGQSAYAHDNDNGFIPLFNGENLEGWKPAKENSDSFQVRGGVLMVEGGRSHLYYIGPVQKSSFTNFELRLKVRTNPGSNSGIFFHTKYQDEGWPTYGLEAQINDTHVDPRKTGSIWGAAEIRVDAGESGQPLLAVGEETSFVTSIDSPSKDSVWFDYAIRVTGKRVSTFVNGQKVIEWTQPDNWTGKDKRLNGGTFAIQAHDPRSVVYLKDIRVKPLE